MDTENGKIIHHLPDAPSLSPHLSADGQTVAEIAEFDQTADQLDPALYSVDSNGDSQILPNSQQWRAQLISFGAFSSDGSVFATMRDGGEIDLWNVATTQLLVTVTDRNYRKDSDNKYAAPYNVGDWVGPGGSEVAILASDVVNPAKVSGRDEYRQVDVWQTPLSPPLPLPGSA